MRLALILSDFADRMRDLQRNLAGDFSVIVGRSVTESMDLAQTLPVDLALVDLDSSGLRAEEIPERIRETRPHCAVVAVLPPDGGGEAVGRSYDAALRADSTPYEISAVLAQVLERQRLMEELERQRVEIRRLQARSERLQAARAPAQPVDKLIKAFSRALSSGFDQERLLNLFADTVMEMMRVSKVSVLLHAREPGRYRIRCFRGLRPDVAEGLCLRSDSGLLAWLAHEGRIMTRELAEVSGVSPEVAKEMDVLQATVSIPMLCSGTLVGVLNLNGRVTGSPVHEDELETLFTLAGHMAVAVEDMGVLRQRQHERTYMEQTLARMRAGVITINDREQVVAYNHRAAEILGKPAEEVLFRDLRRLPAPLGDMLFETMHTGEAQTGVEVVVQAARIPLSVDTYRLEGPDGSILGRAAGIEDLRRRKVPPAPPQEESPLAASRVLSHLAEEVGEPLVRIRELAEMLPDPGKNGTSYTETRDALRELTRRLGALGEKVATFAGRQSFQFEARDLSDIVARAVHHAHRDRASTRIEIVSEDLGGQSPRIQADPETLPRALSALLTHVVRSAQPPGPVEVRLSASGSNGGGTAEVLIRSQANGRAGDNGSPQAAPGSLSSMVDLDLLLGQRVIEEHGGSVAVGCQDQQTLIRVTLPVRTES